ncbi:acyl-CoA thioesterase [Paracoccus aurantiacus]|uniref:Acyl-CoA thioesterase n=1 Tax=Paracoccus aurantiacus TaxID=2599412 RepID=A0A5C6S542_9RHOB|nr:acyl-CoA thioesterase [Paracoccus aurantiacus]TXB69101.1 acyl-CoA thioesterase [Paracoccus aurantiacus]
MQARETATFEHTELVLPAQANHYGTLFAGQGLSMLAQAAFTAASRYARANVVLAAVKDLRFTAPVPVGNLFVIAARVTDAGRSSMTVEVAASREDPQTGERSPVAQGQFQMVAVNEDGRPKKITAQEFRS